MLEDEQRLQGEDQAFPVLAGLLHENARDITAVWSGKILALPESHYHSYSPEDIRNWCAEALAALSESLATGSHRTLKERIAAISRSRLELGFDMRDVLQAWLILREAALPVILAAFASDDRARAEYCEVLERFVRYGADLFMDNYGRYLMNAVKEVTGTLLQEKGFSGVQRVVAREGCRLTGAAGAAILTRTREKRVVVSAEAGESICEIEPLADWIWSGEDSRQPIVPLINNNIGSELACARADSELCSVLIAPLQLRDQELGILCLFNSPRGFNRDDLRVIRLFSDQAAIALEYARLSEEHEEMALLRERQRLARELHDSITQSLYAVTLYAEASARRLAEGDIERAIESVEGVRDTAVAALRDVRLFVYELRPHALSDDGLITTVRNRLKAVEERVGIVTELDCHGIDRLPEQTEKSLHGIIHEALNNILKHAGASLISISLAGRGGKILVDIRDDGTGFDPAAARQKGGLGLSGMEEWAGELGATFTLKSEPGRGTHIHVDMPLAAGKTDDD
jgi:signal transduction histidine kinase